MRGAAMRVRAARVSGGDHSARLKMLTRVELHMKAADKESRVSRAGFSGLRLLAAWRQHRGSFEWSLAAAEGAGLAPTSVRDDPTGALSTMGGHAYCR